MKKSTAILQRKQARYGWIPDLPDQRDQLAAGDGEPPPLSAPLPPRRKPEDRHKPELMGDLEDHGQSGGQI